MRQEESNASVKKKKNLRMAFYNNNITNKTPGSKRSSIERPVEVINGIRFKWEFLQWHQWDAFMTSICPLSGTRLSELCYKRRQTVGHPSSGHIFPASIRSVLNIFKTTNSFESNGYPVLYVFVLIVY